MLAAFVLQALSRSILTGLRVDSSPTSRRTHSGKSGLGRFRPVNKVLGRGCGDVDLKL